MLPLSAEFGRIYDGLHKSSALEKKAELAAPAEATEILVEKAANDYKTFELAKTASLGEAATQFFSHPIGKGLGMAAGAAVPAVIAGNMISNHFTEQARNRALEAGLGLAAVGGTMYGIHRLTSPKTASAETENVQDALLKLASVGYLDEILSLAGTDESASEDAKKLAAEIRMLNREFGVSILRNLMG